MSTWVWTMVDPLREYSPKVVVKKGGTTGTSFEAQKFLEECLKAMGEDPACYIFAKEIINDKEV